MEFVKGQAISGFPFGLVDKTTGDAVTTGTPVVYITIDGGTQFAASGTPVHEGNGQWTINFNGSELDGTFIGITVTHADAINEHFTIKTVAAETTTPVIAVTVSSSGTSIVDDFVYYGTLPAADIYFDNRLNSDCWEQATVNERQNALIQATRLIDRLNYHGEKNTTRLEAAVEQNLQFPRNDDTEVPVEVEYACYEIGIKLLEGIDNELEAKNFGIITERYSGVVTAYSDTYVNEHLRAGIPSAEAWALLKPFLRDPKQIELSRVS